MSILRLNTVLEIVGADHRCRCARVRPANLDHSSVFEVEQQKLHEEPGSGSTFVVSASNVLGVNFKAT
jgi:hypothetical protein